MRKSSSDISSLSYAPYSKKQVYCHILGETGTYYPGVRVENISYPLTIPAINAALCSCLGNDDKPVAVSESKLKSKFSKFWIEKFKLKEFSSIPDDSEMYSPLIKKPDGIQKKLKELSKLSVCRESNFPVTALLKTTEGFIPGVNIEFEEWNLGLCAERTALTRALASGYTDFLRMHVYAPESEYISPCGACRQVLYELMPHQIITLHHDEQSLTRHLISHLLPNGFTSSSLKK